MVTKIITVATSLFLLLYLALFIGSRIPTPSLTWNNMWSLSRQIIQYNMDNYFPPKELTDLEFVVENPNADVDGWGNSLIYSVTPNGEVTIVSKGKDERLGTRDDLKFNFNLSDENPVSNIEATGLDAYADKP